MLLQRDPHSYQRHTSEVVCLFICLFIHYFSNCKVWNHYTMQNSSIGFWKTNVSVSKTCVSSEPKKTAFPYSLSQASVLNYRTGGFWSNAVSVFEKRRVKNCQSFQEQMMASLQDQFFQHCLFIVDKVFASTSEPQLQPPLSSKISKDSSKGGIFVYCLFIFIYLFITIGHVHCSILNALLPKPIEYLEYISTSNDVS